MTRHIDSKIKLDDTALTADRTSQTFEVLSMSGCSFHLVWTGTPTGDFKVQQSNNGTTWVDVASATVAAGGVAGDSVITVSNLYTKLVRLFFDFTSGTGALNGEASHFVAKEA